MSAPPPPAIKVDFGNGAAAEPQSITIQAPKPQQQPMYVPVVPVSAPAHAPAAPPPAPAPIPRASAPSPAPAPLPQRRAKRAPHPLLYVTLAISVLALVLGVPKGTFPTLTGRHKALRAQEMLVTERLTLLSHLSGFLPPPLAALLAQEGDARSALDLVRLGAGLQLWNVNGNGNQNGNNSPDNFWTLQDLGAGAAVVRSNVDGHAREVWVLRGEKDAPSPAVLALAAALAEKERLARQLDACRAAPGEVTLDATSSREQKAVDAAASAREAEVAEREREVQAKERELELDAMRKSDRAQWEKEVAARDAQREAEREEKEREHAAAERRRVRDREEKEREAAERRAVRERLDEMEGREREVARREKWVVDAMRKLSDKARDNANELTMEDRITERLKIYQRQLAELHVD